MKKNKSSLVSITFMGWVLLLFGGVGLSYLYQQFHTQTTRYKEEILKDIHIHFLDLMNTKGWNEFYDGVYVKKRPGVSENPYLPEKIITDKNETLIGINHFWMLRQLSERSDTDEYHFRLSSLHPKNPVNTANAFDKRAFEYLIQHPKAPYYYEFDEMKKEVRFLEGLRNTPKCLACHPNEKLGEMRGGISILYHIHDFYADIQKRGLQAITVGSIFIGMIIGIFILYRKLYRHDEALIEANSRLEEDISESTHMLAEKRLFLQAILDTSPDIIIVTNGEYLQRANKRFYDFFGYDSLESFKKEHDCICDYFESVDDSHYIQDKKIDGKPWPYYLLEHQDDEHKVQMTVNGEKSIFAIKARRLETAELKILVELSDITRLETQKLQFEKMAATDKLTQIANRFHFDLICKHLVEEAKRYQKPLALVMFDIDHFKRVNDRYGHDIGDTILRNVAEIINKRLRSSDVFARWGGEEFVILLPDQTLQEALSVTEALRGVVENTFFDPVGRVTVSFGVTLLHSDDTESSFLKRADKALYTAKNNGRNRVESTT